MNFNQSFNNLEKIKKLSILNKTSIENISTIVNTTKSSLDILTTSDGLFPEFYDVAYEEPTPKRLKPWQIFGLIIGDYDDGSVSMGYNNKNWTINSNITKMNRSSNGTLIFENDDDYLSTLPSDSDPLIKQLKTPLFYILFMLIVYGLIILIVFISAFYAHRNESDNDLDDDEDDENDEDNKNQGRNSVHRIKHTRLREEYNENEIEEFKHSKSSKINKFYV